jgi:23S rRNA (pseudouridine1915-N3)-methyltransferase
VRLRLLSPSGRTSDWINVGFQEFARRLPRECRLELEELPLGRRTKGAAASRAIEDERDRLLSRISSDEIVVALDERGKAPDSEGLAGWLREWMADGQDVALMMGGPDGLHPDCLSRARTRWSLSPLTLPHGLVRIVVAEQIYRAWSILQGHPYHRA